MLLGAPPVSTTRDVYARRAPDERRSRLIVALIAVVPIFLVTFSSTSDHEWMTVPMDDRKL